LSNNSEITKLVKDFKSLVNLAIQTDRTLSISDILNKLQISGFSLICVILSIPFLQPLPLGPFAIFAGTTFTALGLQILRGQETPWLPEKLQAVTLSNKTWRKVAWLLEFIAKVTGYIAKPRYQSLVTGVKGRKIIGSLVFVAGLLMSIPMFGIPFNNTFPALVVLFACIGELQDDGVFIYISLFSLLLTIIYFTAIFVALYYIGFEVIEYFGLSIPEFIKPYIPALKS
jgi:hypothetical protein